MITATIVDDEPDCCEVLATLLERYCKEVRILDICYSAADALRSIKEQPPQMLFLDIEMPLMNGFELLEELGEVHFELIFTTSYDQYAIKAIQFSALEYLLKPIDREDLQHSVQKAIERRFHPIPDQLEMLIEKIKHPAVAMHKIAIPTLEGFQLVKANSILRCEAQSNYTFLFLKNKNKLIASRNLKEIEKMLEDFAFIRVHNSHLVNINEIDKYVKGEGGYLIMSDGATVNVSRSRKELLMKKFLNDK
ncbi:MAG: LytTR family DNA-binding domain-containing protein [Ginsengibacter sp.]